MLIRYYYTFDGVIWHDHKFNISYETFDELRKKMIEFHKEYDNELIKKAYWTNASNIQFWVKR